MEVTSAKFDGIVQLLASAPTLVLPRGMTLFHGCVHDPRWVDISRSRSALFGSRKWFSEVPTYACDYALFGSNDHSAPLLFVCELRVDHIGIVIRQSMVRTKWPLDRTLFRDAFPDAFSSLAHRALPSKERIALVNFRDANGIIEELLIPDPMSAIIVKDIVHLPADHDTAKEMVYARFAKPSIRRDSPINRINVDDPAQDVNASATI